jgi:uncharacterized protein DUF1236
MKKSLLATVAAAALIAGPGLAIAQKQEAPANKTEAPARAPAAVQNAPAEKIAPAGKVAPVTKPETSGQAVPSGKSGDTDIKARSGADTRSGTSVDTKPAPNAQTRSGTSADTKTGADAKTGAQPSGGAVALTTEQKAKIRTSVLTANAPRVTNVNFSLNVGTVVPRTVRVVAVPLTLVEIHPAWRGFLYFVHGDEIVIVEPGTLRIVAVIQV